MSKLGWTRLVGSLFRESKAPEGSYQMTRCMGERPLRISSGPTDVSERIIVPTRLQVEASSMGGRPDGITRT
jgi:hypothetical protein